MSLDWLKRPVGLAAGLLLAASPAAGAEKLQVFILSGQSNMVGHASGYLLANLMDPPRAEDAGLAKLVIADYERTLKTVKPKMDALQKEIDALAGPAGEPRKAARKSKQDDQSPEAQVKSKAHEEVKAKVDALAKERANCFQGFNDKFGDTPTRYKEHMANFIRDIRTEFKTPGMPFVIGVIGTGAAAKKTDYSTLSHAAAVELGKKETADQPVAVAQREAATLPEFAGTVVAAESYPYYDYTILPLYDV
jgi:hypothetical protein